MHTNHRTVTKQSNVGHLTGARGSAPVRRMLQALELQLARWVATMITVHTQQANYVMQSVDWSGAN